MPQPQRGLRPQKPLHWREKQTKGPQGANVSHHETVLSVIACPSQYQPKNLS